MAENATSIDLPSKFGQSILVIDNQAGVAVQVPVDVFGM
jgi:hypothetical protein